MSWKSIPESSMKDANPVTVQVRLQFRDRPVDRGPLSRSLRQGRLFGALSLEPVHRDESMGEAEFRSLQVRTTPGAQKSNVPCPSRGPS